MAWRIAVLAIRIASCEAGAQVIGNCALHEIQSGAGSCFSCPPGEDGEIEFCTHMEISYDSWCAGVCLYHRDCVVSATSNMPVYWEYACSNDCEGDNCSLIEPPITVIYDEMPSGCECEGL